MLRYVQLIQLIIFRKYNIICVAHTDAPQWIYFTEKTGVSKKMELRG